ncbi:2,4-dienoyl-CoA reductase [Chishuiella changwenlii]|uniref:2,4-dienoyl-CoA reductase n=1 Tax=Chishuiella changwenlii TaxID=1434701 RepID=A0A1M6Z7M5_9FLAO|nr:NADH:flavin oxidoreductase [Chishuiella changwenlii]GGE86917.1 NADH:flavin oxidoreductase [Chishuiella changwenlii]SHL26466.1 2,4-dienoyl-CoA reductase [Chishuiella changwenlii]
MLFHEFKIGNLNVKNRFALAPMTRISATEDGIPTEKMKNYYTSFAKGGFGLIITKGNYIDTKYSQTYRLQPGIALDTHIDGWKNIVDDVKANGAKIIMQIQHSGGLSQGNYYLNETIAPSSVQPKGQQLDFYFGNGNYAIPKSASKNDINEIIHSFVKAAKNAEIAGFDGVEIHGANGYLLDQFLTPYSNTRNDEYGGNIENRLRIYVDIIKEIKKNVSHDFVVGIRLSQGKVNDYFHKWKNEEEAEFIFKTVEKSGVDYVHLTEFDATAPAFDTNKYKTLEILSLAQIARKTLQIPILLNGKIDSENSAKSIISEGVADLVTIGKSALANHDFPLKIKEGRPLKEFDAEKTLRPTAELKDFELY